MTALRREQMPSEAVLARPGALWALVVSGAVTLETAHDRRTVLPGDAVLVEARTAHRVTADVETDLVHGDLRRTGPTTPLPGPLVLRGFAGEHGGIVALVTACPLTVQCKADLFADAYARLIGAAVSSVWHQAEGMDGRVAGSGDRTGETRAAAGDTEVAEVVAALAAEPGERWTLDRMAGLVHLSRSALTERFRRATGHSPMRMLREVRMNRARTLLTEQCLPVTRVAFEVGYGSVAAFSRAFAADHGLSPLAWRTAPGTVAGARTPSVTAVDPAAPSGTARQGGTTPVAAPPGRPPARTSGARNPQERPAEPRRHRGTRADHQQRPDPVPVQ
ncbi:AraC family transcriptional regulator [Myceligenerans salitolerans]|uniref:Helix-turn-helix domain-containing protein n=1 Tax=Myceligenerans salitolerans TaxID=1230528 RepID=A0ABS3IAA9_9MICO|nr:AraC family transcriptional regulator [Myceligenerans salitolerans]MBO0609937.1 helix-turn-helix domain-containing protein [Myceligenerans salitolerans]